MITLKITEEELTLLEKVVSWSEMKYRVESNNILSGNSSNEDLRTEKLNILMIFTNLKNKLNKGRENE